MIRTPSRTIHRRTALAILPACSCLTTVLPGRGDDPPGSEVGVETGAERFLRLRARVRSKFVRQGGRIFPDGPIADAGIPAGSSSPEARTFSPEVQASRGVAGTQSEAAVAVSGSRVVVGFNQINGHRGSGVAFFTDGGATLTDSGGLPVGGNLSKELLGDPSVTACCDGTFYYSSIYFPNATDSALAVNVGTFSGTTLSWTNPKVAITSSSDFLDKE